MHRDTLEWGHRVLIVDDVLATGGTLKATCNLVGQTGAELIGCSVLIALADLSGLTAMRHWRVQTLLRY
jgi:adenine phosphoribosyltransferase